MSTEPKSPHRAAAGEDATSQIPALVLLRRLGWRYISPDEALALRGGRQSSVLLTAVLTEKLGSLNRIETKQGPVSFGREAIASAVRRLEQPADEGLVATNEAVWDMLRLGISIDATVDGRKRGVPFRYVDWEDIGRNVFHVTEEFSVDRRGGGQERTRRPDIVCFVNGIPFIVMECKSAAIRDGKDPLAEAISQQLRNQRADEIPHLFHYTQLLLATSVNPAKYGATGTDAAYGTKTSFPTSRSRISSPPCRHPKSLKCGSCWGGRITGSALRQLPKPSVSTSVFYAIGYRRSRTGFCNRYVVPRA